MLPVRFHGLWLLAFLETPLATVFLEQEEPVADQEYDGAVANGLAVADVRQSRTSLQEGEDGVVFVVIDLWSLGRHVPVRHVLFEEVTSQEGCPPESHVHELQSVHHGFLEACQAETSILGEQQTEMQLDKYVSLSELVRRRASG